VASFADLAADELEGPIVTSLLDTDFYKLLMAQFVLDRYPDVEVTFALQNRASRVRLTDMAPEAELRAQLDAVRELRFRAEELRWVADQRAPSGEPLFHARFLHFLRDLKLPAFELRQLDGNYELTFAGPWPYVTWWEIHGLAVLCELRSRAARRVRSRQELAELYDRAGTKLMRKLHRLQQLPGATISEFGTRRRHSTAWQERAVLAMAGMLGGAFAGTSNALLAFRHGLAARGTQAHELAMVLAALAPDDQALQDAQYAVCRQWRETYSGGLLVALPDTFGTAQFLASAPASLAHEWLGYRLDSKPPKAAGDELIAWLAGHGVDPLQRIAFFSDGLDVRLEGFNSNGPNIVDLHNYFRGRIGCAFGWGTNASNDLRECDPRGETLFDPVPLVCKVRTVNGRPAVKLSDNPGKASGPPDAVARYRKIFGETGASLTPVHI